MTFEISLLRPMKPKFGAIRKVALVSMSRVGVVKPAQEMGSSRLRCTFYQMCMSLVKYVMENDTIEKHLKLNTRERVFMMF